VSPFAALEPTAWDLEPATAELIAASVMDRADVARLSPGAGGEVATYLVGRRVVGVRLREAVEVHVVARYGVTVEALAAEVRAAVAHVAPGYAVDVYVDDVDIEPEADVPSADEVPGDRRTASAP
jgi:hypothetical protein